MLLDDKMKRNTDIKRSLLYICDKYCSKKAIYYDLVFHPGKLSPKVVLANVKSKPVQTCPILEENRFHSDLV